MKVDTVIFAIGMMGGKATQFFYQEKNWLGLGLSLLMLISAACLLSYKVEKQIDGD